MIIRFSGGKEIAAALAKLPPRISKRFLIESLTEAAEPMRDAMERNVAVSPDPPHIRDVVVVGTSRGQDTREAAVVVGATRKGYYGSFLEFGTAHQAPQPWARPAFDATFQQALQILSAALWREMASRGIQRTETVETVVQGEA